MTTQREDQHSIYDFVIIGSGFGGSVSAMRLSEKGYNVALLEMGKDYKNSDFPKSNWQITKYLWAPIIKCFGIQKITFLKKVMVLHGVGVGGGSLVYANTLMQPEENVFQNGLWPKGINWFEELKPFFTLAKKMLGVATNPFECENEKEIKKIGEALGISSTYHMTEVGVFFGDKPHENFKKSARDLVAIKDPYFGGNGPDRVPCHGCGSCMIGCPTGAKNTLDKNYLYFARKNGAKIFAQTKAKVIRTNATGDTNWRYEIQAQSSTEWWPRHRQIFRAKNIIVAAGALGSVELLLKNRDHFKTLPKLSAYLGKEVRTNGECLLGATTTKTDKDYSRGVAIGAAIHPDAVTKIEGVKYPRGSGLLRFLAVILTGEGNAFMRPLKFIFNLIWQLPKVVRLAMVKDWAKSSVILLVMQSTDSKLRLDLKRPWWNFFRPSLGGKSEDKPVPCYLPVAQESCQILAENMQGIAQNVASEVLLQTPATAHILGGCVMGDSENVAVLNSQCEVFNYPGLYVCDGSIVPANLAVNPSLTITALAERFCAQFQQKN